MLKPQLSQSRSRNLLFLGATLITSLVAGQSVRALTNSDFPNIRGSEQSIRYPYAPVSPSVTTQRLQQEIAFYQDRIQQRPSDGLERAALAETYLKMARATGQTRWYLQAEQVAQDSLSKLPFDNETATLVLARVAEAKHDFATAVELSQQVLEQKPDNAKAQSLLVTSYLAQGNLAEAGAIAQSLAQQIPTLNTHLLQALTHAAQGKDNAAIEQFDRALSAEEAGETGSSARLRTLFGRFYAERGDLRQARKLYSEALRILPQYPLALNSLAQLEMQQGNYRQAEQIYSQIFASPELASVMDHEALAGRAELAALQGDRDLAQRLWHDAEHHLRDHQDVESFGHRRELAQVVLAIGEDHDLKEAVQLMQKEATIRRDAETLDTLAWALTEVGQLQEAEAIAQEALTKYPRNAQALYRAGAIAKRLGNPEAGQALQQQAELLNPYIRRTASVGHKAALKENPHPEHSSSSLPHSHDHNTKSISPR